MIIDKLKLCNNNITCKWCLVPFCGYDLPLVLRWDELEDDVVEARLVGHAANHHQSLQKIRTL
jgi:hypothetical protein